MSSDRVKRGHFVPQGYLRAFADPARPKQIFVLHKANPGVTFGNPISDVASRLGFYDAEPGDTEQVIEHWFAAEVESPLPHQIAEFIRLGTRRHVNHLPADLLDQLREQMAYQYLRTEQVRDSAESQVSSYHQQPGGIIHTILDQLRQEARLAEVDDFSAEVQEVKVLMDGPAHAALLMNEENVSALVADFHTFTWQLQTTDPSMPFLTSDAPVLIWRPQQFVRVLTLPVRSIVCYPLTPTALLFGQKLGQIPRLRRPPHLVQLPGERVALVNREMFRRAHVQLLGSSREALLAAASSPTDAAASVD